MNHNILCTYYNRPSCQVNEIVPVPVTETEFEPADSSSVGIVNVPALTAVVTPLKTIVKAAEAVIDGTTGKTSFVNKTVSEPLIDRETVV